MGRYVDLDDKVVIRSKDIYGRNEYELSTMEKVIGLHCNIKNVHIEKGLVKVVRCIDCMYSEYYDSEGKRICMHPSVDGYEIEVSGNFFCGYGEKNGRKVKP